MLHDGKSWNTFDLPTKAGLASSSAYTVGLLRVCTELDKQTIAKLATTWEQDKMNGNVGSQDQYLCSVGGCHVLRFNEHGIRDTEIEPKLLTGLQDNLMLFDTHQYRRASDVVANQLEHMKEHENIYLRMAEMADEGLHCIKCSNWTRFGRLFDEAWTLKRQLSDHISTPSIDMIYQNALSAGAIGGKLLGGGGGGFILFFVEPEKQGRVKEALSELTYVPFKFEYEGTQVVHRE